MLENGSSRIEFDDIFFGKFREFILEDDRDGLLSNFFVEDVFF